VLIVRFILHNITVIGLCLSYHCCDTLGLLSLFLTGSHMVRLRSLFQTPASLFSLLP